MFKQIIILGISLMVVISSQALECNSKSKVDVLIQQFNSVKLEVRKNDKSEFAKLGKLVKLAGCLSKIDPSGYAGELLSPFYNKNKIEVEKQIDSLPPEQKKSLMQDLETFEREKKTGNG